MHNQSLAKRISNRNFSSEVAPCFSMIGTVSLGQPAKQWFPKMNCLFLYDAKVTYCSYKDYFCEIVHLPEFFSEFLTLLFVTKSGMVGVWQSHFSVLCISLSTSFAFLWALEDVQPCVRFDYFPTKLSHLWTSFLWNRDVFFFYLWL